jgi:Ras-related protein Rab-6A
MTESSVDANISLSRQKIFFCGDAGVGKTSIIISLMGQKFSEEYEPSIGVDFFSKTIRYKERLIKLQIWDSAGQEKFRSLIPNYIRGSTLIFLIFDITNKTSYDNIPNWIKFITDIDNNGTIILVGNKIDLNEKRVVNKEEAEKFCQEKKYEYFEVSAKEGNNIDNMVYKSISGLPVFKKIDGELYDKDIIFKDLLKENMDSFRYQKNDALNNTGNNIMNTDPGNISNFADLNNNYGINKNGLLQNQTKKKRKCLC